MVTKILQKIFFWIRQLKEMYTGLEQLEGEKLMIEFSFLDELSHVQKCVVMKFIYLLIVLVDLKVGIFTLTRVHFK